MASFSRSTEGADVDPLRRPTACVIFEAFIARAKHVKPSLALQLTDDILPKSIAQVSMRFGRCLASFEAVEQTVSNATPEICHF
ncbi:hypothetical protein Y032_0004g2136 [Ancylostoma ceylanicum]|uniref:Uncharacterized protein n=1 Tax=Ancylostoma ceylanicum TaxID=53326 RepID=A0A016VXA7_9BILA|nr:hypothetical protein Y032_0004g2136 [Ancylostoma ceylanicum]